MAGTLTTMQTLDVILDALRAALERHNRLENLCFLQPVPGSQVAIDYGLETVDCEGGMGWVRLNAKAFGYDFSGNTTENACDDGAPILDVEIGLSRRANAQFTTAAGAYQLPEPKESAIDTEWQLADMEIMEEAIRSLRDTDEGPDFRIQFGQYSPLGPMGGAVGGMWTFSILEDL